MRTANRQDQGFTLIELLVVIVIVGILAGIAFPIFLNQRKKGVDASLRSDLRNLAQIEETYLVENPGAPGITALSDATNLGFRKTPGNTIFVGYHPSARGYCLAARSVNDSMNGTQWIFYDSLAGGFLNGGKHVGDGIPPAGQASVAVACNTGRASVGTF